MWISVTSDYITLTFIAGLECRGPGGRCGGGESPGGVSVAGTVSSRGRAMVGVARSGGCRKAGRDRLTAVTGRMQALLCTRGHGIGSRDGTRLVTDLKWGGIRMIHLGHAPTGPLV